jgi:ubiquinone/menaquinone biosynthesis C-methylase UbiE
MHNHHHRGKEMDTNKMKQDKHFPLFVHNNLIRRVFFSKPSKYHSYVKPIQVVADLGCGPGFFTISLAAAVGPTGTVYAVDSDEKAIRAVERRAKKHGYHNIKTYVASATDLSFIKDESVDFILADGLLCSMAPQHQNHATNEMRRILKPDGLAYLKAAQGSWSYVGLAEWEKILEGFTVEQRSDEARGEGRWAVVSKKQR